MVRAIWDGVVRDSGDAAVVAADGTTLADVIGRFTPPVAEVRAGLPSWLLGGEAQVCDSSEGEPTIKTPSSVRESRKLPR